MEIRYGYILSKSHPNCRIPSGTQYDPVMAHVGIGLLSNKKILEELKHIPANNTPNSRLYNPAPLWANTASI